MKKTIITMAVAVAMTLGISNLAQAADPLVSLDWVKANTDKPGVVLLDIRAANAFNKGHIPGAVNSPYGGNQGWRQNKIIGPDPQKDVVTGMLPSAAYMEKLISKAGVRNDSHVVVIAAGTSAVEIGSATRVYWSLRVLGHDNVSIFDGGLSAWTRDHNPLAKGPVKPTPTAFKVKLDTRFLATPDDVRAAAQAGKLIDARPTDQYLGVNKSAKVTRYGKITGADSLPGLWMTNNKGFFRSKAEVEKLYAYSKASPADGTVTYCNTGHWASLGWFMDYAIMGKKNAKVYDGSLSEWSRLKNAPMDSLVKPD